MKPAKNFLFIIGFTAFFSFLHESIEAEVFPLSFKGWNATVEKISGQNSSRALAIGEVKPDSAKEYCERDPDRITRDHGGKLSKKQCVEKVLKEERGKTYSVSADCQRKTIMTSDSEAFTLIGKTTINGLTQYKWKNGKSGEIFDGNNIPILEAQFQMLCPDRMASDSAIFELSNCRQIIETHGFLSRAQNRCDLKYYSLQVVREVKLCAQTLSRQEVEQLQLSGMDAFDREERKHGRYPTCKDVLHDFPEIVRK